MPEPEVAGFCNGLDKQGFIEFQGGDLVRMKAAGYKALELSGQLPRSGGDIYHTTIHNLQGGAQIGPGNIQNININPEFDQAIGSLLQLVQSSSLAAHDKEELTDEVIKVAKLALRESAPGLIDRVKSRIEIVKVGLASAELLTKAGPYVDAIWHYFKIKHNL